MSRTARRLSRIVGASCLATALATSAAALTAHGAFAGTDTPPPSTGTPEPGTSGPQEPGTPTSAVIPKD